MFSFAVLALAASANAHSFSHIRRHHVPRTQPPAGWATSYLEKYDAYHERYMAIGCENKHNTTFFDFCCHPLLATETVAKNRPACCAVGATATCPGTVASSTAAHVSKPSTPVAVSKPSTPVAVSKPSTPVAVSKPSTAAAPHSTAADEGEDCEDEDDGNTDGDNTDDEDCEDDEDTGNDDGDDDGEECEDDGEEDTSAAPTSTKVAATSHSAVVTTYTQHTTPTTTHTTPTTTPKTTSTKAATTHTTPKPTTTSTAATPTKTSSGNFITGGFGTWFTQGGVAGACGKVHKDSDFVVALDTKMYANGVNCGRTIRVTDLSNGKTAEGLVADECPTCRNGQSVDMSVSMFQSLAALSVGEFSLKYEFLD